MLSWRLGKKINSGKSNVLEGVLRVMDTTSIGGVVGNNW